MEIFSGNRAKKQIYLTCEACGKDTPNDLDPHGLCPECVENETFILGDNQAMKESPLDKVCIMQKHNDSERVLECREEFNKAEQYIIIAVNNYDPLVEALKECLKERDFHYLHGKAKEMTIKALKQIGEQ